MFGTKALRAIIQDSGEYTIETPRMQFSRLVDIAHSVGGRFVVKRKATKTYLDTDKKKIMDWYDYNRPKINMVSNEQINFIDSGPVDATLYFWS